MQFADIAVQHIGWAMAVLGWHPDQAWAATPADVRAAHAAYLRWHGLEQNGAPCSVAELNQMQEKLTDG